jgi:hypothetical protein
LWLGRREKDRLLIVLPLMFAIGRGQGGYFPTSRSRSSRSRRSRMGPSALSGLADAWRSAGTSSRSLECGNAFLIVAGLLNL